MTERKKPEQLSRLEQKAKGMLDRKNNPKGTKRVRAKPQVVAAEPVPKKVASKPVGHRMPDKKPDNWNVHQTGPQTEFDAAVKAAMEVVEAPDEARTRKFYDGFEPWSDGKGKARNERGTPDDFDGEMRDRDIVTTDVQPARAFRSEIFANANIALVSDYADYRVMGWNPERAFIRVFGTDYGDVHLFARIEALEHNVIYRQVFAKRFGATPLSRMFSVKHAIWHWLSLLNNPFVRETVRATAIQQLQTIYGITVVDEAGVTKVTKSLDDFYRDEQTRDPASTESNPQSFRHPDPGTVEAVAFESALRGESTGENTATA